MAGFKTKPKMIEAPGRTIKMGQYYPAFKAYDIRGKLPDEINPELAYRIGRAYADEIQPRTVCVGYDIRLSGPELCDAFSRGVTDAGADVIDLGMIGTEMVYFATAFYGYDGGVMITASHNPPEYNGFKLVTKESRPISSDTGLYSIEERTHAGNWQRNGNGSVQKKDVYDDFIAHLLNVVDPASLKPLKVLLDVGNGAAGVALEKLLPHLPLQVTKRHFEPDGHFPNGVPNPILPESRAGTEDAIRAGDFDMAVSWDGDYDRCFFLDAHGDFIEGYYIVGLLAQSLLHNQPGETIVYDPRLTWNTLEIVKRLGGHAEICKSGHAFIKEKMRDVNAIYGGEMSAHHYFRAHWYCDSGMIPFLLVSKLLSVSGGTLHELVGRMIENYPCSGEINSTVADVRAVLKDVEEKYGPGGEISRIDGLSIEYAQWRFNLRGSNTEPVIRLNVESRHDPDLVKEKTEELLAIIRG